MKRSAVFLFSLFLIFSACTSLYQKGQKQFQSGEYQFAIATFSKVLENDPDNKEANFYLAESYRLSNRIENSAAYYEKLAADEASFENY